MVDSSEIFRVPGRVELATERCDLSCAWCEYCRGRDLPPATLERVRSSAPPADAPVVRIRGGDPFRYGALVLWVTWGRRAPDAAVCIEGPAATLAAPDRRAVAARILDARPDGVSAVLPTVDPARTLALTGAAWDPSLAVETLNELRGAGLAIEIVFPVHPSTVAELPSVVCAVAQ